MPTPPASDAAAGQQDTTGANGYPVGAVQNTSATQVTADTFDDSRPPRTLSDGTVVYGSGAAYGKVGPEIQSSTQAGANFDTSMGWTNPYNPASPGYQGNPRYQDYVPVGTGTATQPDTTVGGGSIGGTPYNDPAYRAPNNSLATAGIADTTLTDKQPGGSLIDPAPSYYNMTNQDVANIGAPGFGGPKVSGVVPGAPAAPTVANGPRCVYVTVAPVADPANDPVLGYAVVNSMGGVTFGGGRGGVVKVTNLNPGQPYTFKVAARNNSGVGALSPASAVAYAYNPEASDVRDPGGLEDWAKVNPVYTPQGTIANGTGPALTGVTAGAPGSFSPSYSGLPASLASLKANPVVGDSGSNKPGAAWTTGQYVVLGDKSKAYWNATAWIAGTAP